MHPTLLIDYARDVNAERLRAADRARTERASRAVRRASRPSRLTRGVPARASGPIDRTTAAVLEVPAR